MDLIGLILKMWAFDRRFLLTFFGMLDPDSFHFQLYWLQSQSGKKPTCFFSNVEGRWYHGAGHGGHFSPG